MTSIDVRAMLEKPKQAGAVIMGISGSKLLSDLILVMGHDPKIIPVADLQQIADRLAKLARHDRGWSWRYLRNVLNGNLEPSRKLIDAMCRMGAVLDDTPEELAASQTVVIQALGKVKPGALVLADSKLCANPRCGVEFVPKHPRQIYHSPRCREINRKAGAR